MLARCITALTVSGMPAASPRRRALLARIGALVAGDVIGGAGLVVLDGNLHVVEPGIGELAERLRGDADRRGDEIGVEAASCAALVISTSRAARRARRRRDAPAARRAPPPRLNTRAQVAVSSSSARPSSASGLEQYGTAERTAVRQLGEQAERARSALFGVASIKLRSASCRRSPLSIAITSVMMRSRGALKVFARSSTISLDGRLAGAALDDLGRDAVGLEHALRREQHPAALRLVVRQPHAARQLRLGVGRRSLMHSLLRHECARRNVARRHIGESAARRASTTARRT